MSPGHPAASCQEPTNHQTIRAVGNDVEKVPVPRGSLARAAFEKAHYADAFRIQIHSPALAQVDAYTAALLTSAPEWVARLMTLRDRLAGLGGLKTAPEELHLPSRFVPGVEVGLFRVYGRSDDEILMGQDDRHLDFRISVLHQYGEDHQYMVVSTVVQFNNWFGRAYFAPVRLFHSRIVPAMMRAATGN